MINLSQIISQKIQENKIEEDTMQITHDNILQYLSSYNICEELKYRTIHTYNYDWQPETNIDDISRYIIEDTNNEYRCTFTCLEFLSYVYKKGDDPIIQHATKINPQRLYDRDNACLDITHLDTQYVPHICGRHERDLFGKMLDAVWQLTANLYDKIESNQTHEPNQ